MAMSMCQLEVEVLVGLSVSSSSFHVAYESFVEMKASCGGGFFDFLYSRKQ